MHDISIFDVRSKCIFNIRSRFGCQVEFVTDRLPYAPTHKRKNNLGTRLIINLLNGSLYSYTLNAQLGDNLQFQCRVDDSELPSDRTENIILLREESHLNSCDTSEGPGVGVPIGSGCSRDGFNIGLPISERMLANVPTFAAGETYYFTSKY